MGCKKGDSGLNVGEKMGKSREYLIKGILNEASPTSAKAPCLCFICTCIFTQFLQMHQGERAGTA